jgi:lipopolysaccharide biosynthesis regulator YciM
MVANLFDQAAVMYTQIMNDDAVNLSAWMGLVSAHHELKQDNEAIADVEKMPPATYEAALNDAAFLSMLGSIYQQANQFDVAQNLLERSATAGPRAASPACNYNCNLPQSICSETTRTRRTLSIARC